MEIIGSGSFGVVYKYVDIKKSYAIKKIECNIDQYIKTYKIIDNEIKIHNLLKSISEKYIVNFIKFMCCVRNNNTLFFMIYDLMDMTLLTLISNYELTEFIIKNIALNIAIAISFLHKIGVIHCDISIKNILCNIKSDNLNLVEAKLSDFNLCTFIKYNDDNTINTNPICNRTYKGTMSYFAPEVILTSEKKITHYNNKIDIWSYGITLFHVVIKENPFIKLAKLSNNEDSTYINFLIVNGKYDFSDIKWNSMSKNMILFISKLLIVNPADRYSITDVINDKWFK